MGTGRMTGDMLRPLGSLWVERKGRFATSHSQNEDGAGAPLFRGELLVPTFRLELSSRRGF